jgi:hypothetical protein
LSAELSYASVVIPCIPALTQHARPMFHNMLCALQCNDLGQRSVTTKGVKGDNKAGYRKGGVAVAAACACTAIRGTPEADGRSVLTCSRGWV